MSDYATFGLWVFLGSMMLCLLALGLVLVALLATGVEWWCRRAITEEERRWLAWYTDDGNRFSWAALVFICWRLFLRQNGGLCLVWPWTHLRVYLASKKHGVRITRYCDLQILPRATRATE